MMKSMIAFLLMLFGFSAIVHGQTTDQAQQPVVPPPGMPAPQLPPPETERKSFRVLPLEPVSQGIYRIGEIVINKTEKSISFPAEINMDKGLLEYVLVMNGGKTHESLLRTRIEPYNLQVACLLLGLEPTTKPLAFQGSPETPKGGGVAISISMKDGRTVLPESWMKKVIDGRKEDIQKLSWVYTGSLVSEGRFAAQAEGSIIAVFHDPAAMIDNASAGGESDKIWFVNEASVPTVGTPVTVTISRQER